MPKNGSFQKFIMYAAVVLAIAGVTGAIRSYAQQEVLDNRVSQLEKEQVATDAMQTAVTTLATEFKGFKTQYGKDQVATTKQLEAIIELVKN